MTSPSKRAEWFADENYFGILGAGHSVSSEPEQEDVVERLRRVVEEVTRSPLPERSKRIGFL